MSQLHRSRWTEIDCATGSRIFHTFDEEGQLLSQFDERGLQYRYELSGEGNIVLYEDAKGHVTHYQVDALVGLRSRPEVVLATRVASWRTGR